MDFVNVSTRFAVREKNMRIISKTYMYIWYQTFFFGMVDSKFHKTHYEHGINSYFCVRSYSKVNIIIIFKLSFMQFLYNKYFVEFLHLSRVASNGHKKEIPQTLEDLDLNITYYTFFTTRCLNVFISRE